MSYLTNLRPLGYQQITGLSASTALTVPAGASVALIKSSVQAIRIRDDGIAPTATIGYPVAVGVEYRCEGGLSSLRIIEQVLSATVDVLYYGAA